MENIIIAGRGKTSRANIEALMEDYYYANKSVNVYVVSNDTHSDSLNWAVQHAEDMKVNVEAIADSDAIDEVFRKLSGTDTSVFLVWDDEDTDCQTALRNAKKNSWPVFDLTNGLYALEGAADIPKVVEPKLPPEEIIESDTSEDSDEDEDPLYDAIYTIAEIIAEAVFERFADMQSKKR